MERRGIAEAGGAALVSAVLAVGALWLVVGYIDWVLVVGLAAGVAIAAAANYRARTGHADAVEAEAPDVTADNFERHTPVKAGDGGTEGVEESEGEGSEPSMSSGGAARRGAESEGEGSEPSVSSGGAARRGAESEGEGSEPSVSSSEGPDGPPDSRAASPPDDGGSRETE